VENLLFSKTQNSSVQVQVNGTSTIAVASFERGEDRRAAEGSARNRRIPPAGRRDDRENRKKKNLEKTTRLTCAVNRRSRRREEVASVAMLSGRDADHRNRHSASDGLLIPAELFVWEIRRGSNVPRQVQRKNRPVPLGQETWRSGPHPSPVANYGFSVLHTSRRE